MKKLLTAAKNFSASKSFSAVDFFDAAKVFSVAKNSSVAKCRFSKKIFSAVFSLFFFTVALSAQVYSAQQPIFSDSWIYDALYHLNGEAGQSSVLDNAPLTADELYLNFQQIDREKLSDSGKSLYDKAESFFNKKKFFFDFYGARFTANAVLNPVAAVRTNTDVDWTYASSYTESSGYVSSDIGSTIYEKPLASFPFVLDFSDLIFICVEPYAGSGPFWSLTSDFYAVNVPTGNNGAEFFMWPLNAYAAAGKSFGNWGVSLQTGRLGLSIGRTLTGSIIYDSSFQTDFYTQLNIFSPRLKYTLDVAQIDASRFFYIHSAEIIPFKWLKLGIMEGTLVDGSFELRYLNPLIFMHSFSGWRQYSTKEELDYYGEAHYCAYFGLSLDIVPCPNIRIYALYSQNEIQSSVELNNDYDYSYPDSLAFQLGAEFSIPHKNSGYFTAALEGVYTTPFMYLKQTKAASLVNVRDDIYSNGLGRISSWAGSPFGPDAAGGKFSFGYENALSWKCGFSYQFVAHGTNSFGLFDRRSSDGKYEAYYPSAIYLQNKDDVDFDAASTISVARTYALTPCVQYTNTVSVTAEYYILQNLKVQGECDYTFVFNHKGKPGVFAHGFQSSVGIRYELF